MQVIFDENLEMYRVVDTTYFSYGVFYSLLEASEFAEKLQMLKNSS